MKTFPFVILLLFSFFLSQNAFPQSDMNQNSIILSDMKKNAHSEELARENSVKVERNIPQSLLDQIETAKQNDDYDEVQRLEGIVNDQYRDGIKVVNSGDYVNEDQPVYSDGSNPPFNGDWLGTDVTLRTFTGQNNSPRTMDMVMAEDGNLYVAFCTDESPNRFIRFYRSSNSGGSWTLVGGLQTTGYISSISMVCDRRSASDNDSLRIICYYTRASATTNDGAVLAFVSLKPNASSPDYIIQTISTPASGNEFNYCSAFSDGQYFSTATYQGVVAGEYNNANDDLISFHYLRTTNWGTSHTEVSFLGGNDDFYPFAQFVGTTSDSVFIAVERRFTGFNEIRLIKTPFVPTAATNTDFLTSGGSGVFYEKPVLNVQQTAQTITHRMMITVIKDDVAKYLNSANGGSSWGLDFTLDQTNSVSCSYTWCASDTNQTTGYFCAIWRKGSGDSINVRRGQSGSLGSTDYDVMSNTATGTAFPVCAVYHNSDYSVKRSGVAIYGFGGFGTNAYYNGENLPTSITPVNNVADNYSLNQNYPNPFNPSTSINFSVPKSTNVKLVVYDMLGKEVATLVNQQLTPGSYNIDFNGTKLSSGVYFYKLITSEFTDIKKMMLVK